RRIRDALLRSGIDDGARGALIDHALRERLHAVHDAPQVHAEHALPTVVAGPWTAATADAGVVHQHRDVAECFVRAVAQSFDIFEVGVVGTHCERAGTQ